MKAKETKVIRGSSAIDLPQNSNVKPGQQLDVVVVTGSSGFSWDRVIV